MFLFFYAEVDTIVNWLKICLFGTKKIVNYSVPVKISKNKKTKQKIRLKSLIIIAEAVWAVK